ncbi:MAG TPA: sigma-70 family RNA polymerase sigma factor [Geminicoccaceae bacterium]|nr:sigma-70 family RNA polymerase sigma factor [Geminicoccaceae bacterium]
MSIFREDIAALIPHLRAFARSLTSGDVHLSDDLVQDTILKAIEAQAQFQPGTNLKAWLFTILRNQHLSLMRRKRTRNEVADVELEQLVSVPAFQESKIEVEAFRRAFRELGADHRAVLVLVCVQGLAYDEVARIMGCEVGTVKSRVNRARNALKRMLLGDEMPLRPAAATAERLGERARAVLETEPEDVAVAPTAGRRAPVVTLRH